MAIHYVTNKTKSTPIFVQLTRNNKIHNFGKAYVMIVIHNFEKARDDCVSDP